jgi:hypothetical protein
LPVREASISAQAVPFSHKNDPIEADLASRDLEGELEATVQEVPVLREELVVVEEEDMCTSATEGIPPTLDALHGLRISWEVLKWTVMVPSSARYSQVERTVF